MDQHLSQYIVKAPKGTVLFKEGDAGSDMYFVHSGKVKIEKDMEGKTEVLTIMEKGDFFGEMSLLDQVPRSATAIVSEDAELLRVDSGNFQKLLEGNIEIAIRMIRKYTARLRDTNERYRQMLKERTEVDQEINEILKSVKGKPKSDGPSPSKELAHFVSEAGAGTFAVTKEAVMIGRQDPVTNLVPDIDLTSADTQRSVSRRHARLQHIDGQFLLMEEAGVSNGTFVDGKKVVAGQPVPLPDGSEVLFGRLPFTFRVKKS